MRKVFSALILTLALFAGVAGTFDAPAEAPVVASDAIAASEHPADVVQATPTERERMQLAATELDSAPRLSDADERAALSAYMAWPATTNARARPAIRCRTV